jgi:hypothetical protein
MTELQDLLAVQVERNCELEEKLKKQTKTST